MSENDEKPLIPMHALVNVFDEVFKHLHYQDLLQCRLVCYDWHELIKNTSQLIDQFRFKLVLDSGTVVDTHQPPFSIMSRSSINLKSIKIKEVFLDIGNNIAVVEANKSKMLQLSKFLSDMNAFETVTEMIVYARDDEPRTNVLLMAMIRQMRNLKVLKFTLPSFVHCLETSDSTIQCNSLEHVEIVHTDCKRLIVADFERMLQIFPNIKRIDVKTTEAMLLGENIYEKFASLIKSVETLETYTLIDLADTENLSLTHISYECCVDDPEDDSSTLLFDFISSHNVETVCLKLENASSQWFFGDLRQVPDLELSTDRRPENFFESQLCNILKRTPNLTKFAVKFKTNSDHQFGHEVVELKDLTEVMLTKFNLNCIHCCATILRTIVNVKSLRLTPRFSTLLGHLPLEMVNSIATNLRQLECLELIYYNNVDLHNDFESWPAMPKLKCLVVNRVGYVTDAAIRNLQTKCPLLEVIHFYSLRGSRINSLLELTLECFPNIEAITLRGGRTTELTQLDYIQGKVGWRLKKLDISPSISEAAILKIFKNNEMLETICCKYGALVVTRRIYYEVSILKAYDLRSMEEPLKNRKRLHLEEDNSSDSETSSSEESSSENESNEEDEIESDD